MAREKGLRRPFFLFRLIYQVVVRAVTPFAWLLLRLRYHGIGNLPRKGPFILCSNHRCVIDPFELALGVRQHLYFMAKSELFTDHGPLARGFLYAMGAFPVHRDSADAQSLRTAQAVLARGDVLAIFPQGRVIFDNSPFRAKAGAVLIAARAGVPVVPVSIYVKGPWRPFKRVCVRFGKPLPPQTFAGAERDRKTLHAGAKLLADAINHMLGEGF